MQNPKSKIQNKILGEMLFGRLSHIPMEKHGELIEKFLEENPVKGQKNIKEHVETGVEWIKKRYNYWS